MEKGDKKTSSTPSKEEDEADMETEAGSSGKGRSSAKKRKVYQMDPRSPLKRQRIKIERFQSPMVEETHLKPKMIKEEIITLYKKGTFIAVRGAEETFYLCKSLQNVTNTTKRFRIQWLSLDQEPNIYKLDYIDHTEFACVLTNVKMDRIAKDTYRLPDHEQVQAQKVLEKAIKVENGIPLEEEELPNDEEEFESEDEEEVEEEEEDEGEWEDVATPAKRRRKSGKAGKKENGTAKGKGKSGKKGSERSKGKSKAVKEKVKKERKKKVVEKKERKKGPDRNLKPNPKIKVLEKDPFFETKEKVPFISIPVYSRLVIRAAYLNDINMMKDLLKDENVYSASYNRSVGNKKIAFHYALRNGNKEMMHLLLDEMYNNSKEKVKIKKNRPPNPLLQSISTGTYNPVNLGIRNVRKLNVSRGSRQGNDAFSEDADEPESIDCTDLLQCLIEYGCDWKLIEEFIDDVSKYTHYDRDETIGLMLDQVDVAVSLGHKQLAAKLVQEAEKKGGLGFNFLHKEVLSFDKEDLRQNVMAVSVRKKPIENAGITPVHCAAINPNIKYLSRLISIEPDINVMDKKTRRPLHFAAACEGTGPLEYLLGRGASPFEAIKDGQTPLHCACVAGRQNNVDMLLKKSVELEKSLGEDAMAKKWGHGGIDRPTRLTYTPLHMAIIHHHPEVVRVLIKHGVNLNKQLSAGKEKLSPLMLASASGQLDIVRMLVQAGATVELLDKHKRTALTHAVKNGNTHVASYLLYLGADPNRADSSGNTLVHYAAAYGWYFCLRLLVKDAGADAVVANHWKTTPLSIAFLKGHVGIMDFLLTETGEDINFRNDDGVTIVCLAASSRLVKSLLSQIKYLVKEKGADPALADIGGRNALHRLAANTVCHSLSDDNYLSQPQTDTMELSVEICKILVDGGCNPSDKDIEGRTPIMMAVQQGNSILVKYLIEIGGTISPDPDKKGCNLLHNMASECLQCDMGFLVELITKRTQEADGKEKMDEGGDAPVKKSNGLQEMVHVVNDNGRTPLLEACHTIFDTLKTDLRRNRYYRHHSDDHAAEVKKQQCRHGISFLKALINILKADVNDTVQELALREGEVNKRYGQDGKSTGVHIIVRDSKCQENSNLLECLELLLKHKPNLELRDTNNDTPLSIAVKNNQEKIVKLLLENGANCNIEFVPSLHRLTTPLVQAAELGNEKMIETLVKFGANTNAKCNNGKAALHYIVARRDDEAKAIRIAGMLLSHKADINAVCNKKRTPFIMAVNSNQGTANASTDLEEFLMSKEADIYLKDIRGRTALHYVFVQIGGHTNKSHLDPIDLCSLLTASMGAKCIDDADNFDQTPLHRAAFRGATICCMHLIQRKANMHAKDTKGNTPLSIAVTNGHNSCAIMLIQTGANARDNIILDKPASTEIKCVTEVGKRSVLIWRPFQKMKKRPVVIDNVYPVFQGAIKDELQGVAHMLLEKTGIDRVALEDAITVTKYNVALRLIHRVTNRELVQKSNNKGQNLFHTLMIKSKPGADVTLQLKVAQKLLELGVAINKPDDYGCTPIFYAALYHHPPEVAEFFIDKNDQFDINWKDKFGRNLVAAFLWDFDKFDADWDKSKKWLEILLKKKVSFDFHFDRPLPDALAIGLVLRGNYLDYYTVKSSLGISPLIYAIHNFHINLVTFLLQSGASPNLADTSGLTPLMHAVKLNELEFINLLLNNKWKSTKESKPEEPKQNLVKRLSRTVFNLNVPLSYDPSSVVTSGLQAVGEEEEEEEEEEQEDPDDKLEDEDVEEDAMNEEMGEDGFEDEEGEEGEEGEEEEEEEGSDGDTDIVSEEEKEEAPENIALGQKKISLFKRLSTKREFQAVEKTSNVDLSAVDGLGWNVIHHAVASLDYGTFDNEEAIYILAKAGASVTQKDKAGLSPLDHSLIRGAPKSAAMIQRLMDIPEEKFEKPTKVKFEVIDSLSSDDTVYNCKQDSEKLLEEIYSRTMDTSEETEIPVDSNCNFASSGTVYTDPKTKVPFDILMSKVNVNQGRYGKYSFYKMQIVHQKGKDLYVLFTRWGRIGDRGEYQHTPYNTPEEAAKEFCKIFKSKSGNEWQNLDSFVNKRDKYRIIHREVRKKVPKIQLDLTSTIPSKLSPQVLDLMTEMCDKVMLENTVRKIGLDISSMPFGQIKREVLLEARKILLQIGELVNIANKQENIIVGKEDELQSNIEQICKLTNEYYHLIPMEGFTQERIQPIDNKDEIKRHMRKLSDLLDLAVASEIILGAKYRLKDVNPYDYIYKSMNCKIQPLPEETIETQYLLEYIRSSSPEIKPHAIFKLSRPGEEETMSAKNLKNHRLLFHGSKMGNFMSILKKGLLVAPVDAPITGHLFGEGIYSADCFAKSKGYSSNNSSTSNINLMLVCEVALGKCKQTIGFDEDDLIDPEYNSLKILGRRQPDPLFDVALPYGTTIPLGMTCEVKAERRPHCEYNEYVIHDASQICLRYLIMYTP